MTNEQFIKKCFNSKDIADHCIAIGHELTLLEKAVIVHWSNITMQDKLEVYHALLDTEQDMEVPDSIHHNAIPSLKEWLTWLVEYREAPIRFDPEKVHEDWHLRFLEDFFILVPTPFKRGDIVCKPREIIEDYYDAYDKSSVRSQLFVLGEELNLWTKWAYEHPWENFMGTTKTIIAPFNWDDTDMDCEMAYQLSETWLDSNQGGFFYDHTRVNYLDLEYCHDELEGRYRVLEYISLHLKDELRIDDFIDAMNAVKYEEIANRALSMKKNVDSCIERKKAKEEEEKCQE